MPQNGGGMTKINQPSGWRKATAGLAVAEQHAQAGERVAIPKTQAFVAVKRIGAHIGLKAGDMLLLDTLGAFTQAQDWEEGRRPIVWASNAYLMEQTGFSLSALKRHARRLAEIGVISFKDSPNGKRWGHRDADGVIIELTASICRRCRPVSRSSSSCRPNCRPSVSSASASSGKSPLRAE